MNLMLVQLMRIALQSQRDGVHRLVSVLPEERLADHHVAVDGGLDVVELRVPEGDVGIQGLCELMCESGN
jgi:hypothetical protein